MFDNCIILISGKAGAGKTTFAKSIFSILIRKSKYRLGIIPFAKHLKYAAKAHLGWDGEKDESGRKFLQDLGKIVRAYNKDFWISTVERSIDEQDIIIIDDWRFPNEYDYFYQNGYRIITVRINRPGFNLLKGDLAKDVSEIALSEYPSDYDYYILNDGNLDDFRNLTEKIAYEIISDLELNKEETTIRIPS